MIDATTSRVPTPIKLAGQPAVAATVPVERIAAPTAAQVIKTWSKDWQQSLLVRSVEQQAALNLQAEHTIHEIQQAFTPGNGSTKRAQHAKALYMTTQATFRSAVNLPGELAAGPFFAGNRLRAVVRISSVSGKVQADDAKDLRGIAIRLTDDQGHVQDLLMNTSAEFMAKDAPAALVGAEARGVGLKAVLRGIFHRQIGPLDAFKMILAGKHVESNDTSLAAHSFWSRTPFQLGEYAVKLRLVPAKDVLKVPSQHGADELSADLETRLDSDAVRYVLQVQGYSDPHTTPLNDARETWNTPWVTVGELALPRQTRAERASSRKQTDTAVDGLAFSIGNRWSVDPSALKGVGDINAIREAAYKASAEGRGAAGPATKRCPFGFG